MENLEAMNAMIDCNLKEIERRFKAIKNEKVYTTKRDKAAGLKREIESLNNQLSLYIQLSTATEAQKAQYFQKFNEGESKAKEFARQLAELESEISRGGGIELTDRQTIERNGPRNLEDMDRQQLVEHVDAVQNEADEDLDDIILELNKGRNIMDEVTIEIRRQQEKLSKAKEEIEDTYSLSKRSKALVGYFRRTMMTDKLLIALVILIIIAVIVVIILKIVGFKNDSNNQTVIPT